jgi:hypothetical protein
VQWRQFIGMRKAGPPVGPYCARRGGSCPGQHDPILRDSQMKPFGAVAVLLLSALTARSNAPCRQPVWATDLTSHFQFRPFGGPKHSRTSTPAKWKLQQGVMFVSPETLAIFQVIEGGGPPVLESRDPSGGGGRYSLLVVFFDAATGHELKTIHLATSSLSNSRIYRTHDGQFLIRTGQVLALYSRDLREIGSVRLQDDPDERNQSWSVNILSSGHSIEATLMADNGPRTAFLKRNYFFDADTLQSLSSPPLSDSDSPITARIAGFTPRNTSCPSGFVRLASGFFAGYGCQELRLFTSDGLPYWDIPVKDQVSGMLGNGILLVAAIYRHRGNPFDLDLAPEPLRIEIYDTELKSERCYIPADRNSQTGFWPEVFFDLSDMGGVAVVQGTKLDFYEP